MKLETTNEFLKTYLEYVEHTESPRIFHIWAALVGISSCLGRKSFLPFGISPMFPNLFVLLVGPPATRKGTAMKYMKRNLKASTKIMFGPTDTGGKKQGLITAFEKGMSTEEEQELENLLSSSEGLSANDMLETIGNIEFNIDPANNNFLCITASEFTSLTGEGNAEFLVFLQEMYDGEDYVYQLKKESKILIDPLMVLIGCTTPTNISNSLPAAAIGQGFTSRVLLVFSDSKYKRIAKPPTLPEKLGAKIKEIYSEIYYNFQGPFKETETSEKLSETIYNRTSDIADHRFIYYSERRHTHLLKVAMCLAAARLSQTIDVQDVQFADELLKYTEHYMPEALGEFGMSPLAKSKQKLIDFLNSITEPISMTVLWQIMHRDMTQRDFPGALADLVNAGKIVQINSESGPAYIARSKSSDSELLESLAYDSKTLQ